MNGDFKNHTTKETIAKVLLSCLDWGCSANWSPDMESKIQKRLKVQFPFDSWRIRSCIDLIEDTEYAILSFSEHGLQKFSAISNKDLGEIYIRLYGVLNAVQQQRLAIIELFETLKLSKKRKITEILGNLKVMEIRNVAGAHTINLKDSNSNLPENFNTNFFRITQCKLNSKADNMDAVDGFGNLRNYNLYESILEYNRVSEKILYDGTIEYMNKIFKNCPNKKDELLKHYEIEEFTAYDYQRLYKNDKLEKKYFKRINRKLEKEFEEEYGANWKNKIAKEMNDITFEDYLKIEIAYRNKITPP